MKSCIVLGSLLVIVVALGCDVQYTEAPGTGTIGGNPFTMIDGTITSIGFVELYDEEKDFSDPNAYSVTYPHLLFSLPEIAVGKYILNFKLSNDSSIFTATGLSAAGVNVLFDDGYIEITEVTSATVSGGMRIEAGDDVLDGTFELERVSW